MPTMGAQNLTRMESREMENALIWFEKVRSCISWRLCGISEYPPIKTSGINENS